MREPIINLYHRDCLPFLKSAPTNCYDFAVVDPPYGIGADNPSKKTAGVRQLNGTVLNTKIAEYSKKNWDVVPPPEYFHHLFRVSKHQIIFGVNYFSFIEFGPGRIVWDKMNDSSNQFDCEIAYCSITKRTDLVYYMWAGMLQGATPSNKLSVALKQEGDKSKNEKRIHPTQKPVKLYEWLFKKYSFEGAKILDTHGGSMSSAIAAFNRNMSIDLFEIDKEYFNEGKKRVDRHMSQIIAIR